MDRVGYYRLAEKASDVFPWKALAPAARRDDRNRLHRQNLTIAWMTPLTLSSSSLELLGIEFAFIEHSTINDPHRVALGFSSRIIPFGGKIDIMLVAHFCNDHERSTQSDILFLIVNDIVNV